MNIVLQISEDVAVKEFASDEEFEENIEFLAFDVAQILTTNYKDAVEGISRASQMFGENNPTVKLQRAIWRALDDGDSPAMAAVKGIAEYWKAKEELNA